MGRVLGFLTEALALTRAVLEVIAFVRVRPAEGRPDHGQRADDGDRPAETGVARVEPPPGEEAP